jgi:hypothetical protein
MARLVHGCVDLQSSLLAFCCVYFCLLLPLPYLLEVDEHLGRYTIHITQTTV